MSKTLTIGDVEVPGRVWIAPMTGISDLPFRKAAGRLGAAYAATEMVACAEFARHRPDVVRRAAEALPLQDRVEPGEAEREGDAENGDDDQEFDERDAAPSPSEWSLSARRHLLSSQPGPVRSERLRPDKHVMCRRSPARRKRLSVSA